MAETARRPTSVAEALLRRTTKKKSYRTMPTGVVDTTIRLERGAPTDVSPAVLGSVVANAAAFYEGQQHLDRLAEAQEGYAKTLKDIAAEHGLRGVFLHTAKTMLAIFPQDRITWVGSPGTELEFAL